MRQVRPRAVFLAHSLGDGYVPPTYRPLVPWIRSALQSLEIPPGSSALWRTVLAAERERLEHPAASVARSEGAREEDPFWRAWQAYLSGDHGHMSRPSENCPRSCGSTLWTRSEWNIVQAAPLPNSSNSEYSRRSPSANSFEPTPLRNDARHFDPLTAYEGFSKTEHTGRAVQPRVAPTRPFAHC